MQEKGNWFCNKYIRIKNPLLDANIEDRFIGSVSMYDFKTFTKKFNMLKESLVPFDISLMTIYACETKMGTSFVVDTNSPIVWYKRASNTRSANNFLYLGKHKIKLSDWLAYNHEQRTDLINLMNQNL